MTVHDQHLLARTNAELARLKTENVRLRRKCRSAIVAAVLAGLSVSLIAHAEYGDRYQNNGTRYTRDITGYQNNPYWNYVPGRLCCTVSQVSDMARANTAQLQAKLWHEQHPILSRILGFFGITRDFGGAHYEAPGYGSWSW